MVCAAVDFSPAMRLRSIELLVISSSGIVCSRATICGLYTASPATGCVYATTL